MMREHQVTVSSKTAKLSFLALYTRTVLEATFPSRERRLSAVLCAPWRGFGERSWFGALSIFGDVNAKETEKSF